jgi:hypothetical protein
MHKAVALLRGRLGAAGSEGVRKRYHEEIVIKRLSTVYETLADRCPAEV